MTRLAKAYFYALALAGSICAGLLLAGCASIQAPVSPDVARLQTFADSIEKGWQIKTGWADPGYLATMRGHQWSFYPPQTIYLRDEVLETRCAEVVVAALFARKQAWIPYGFGQAYVDKEAVNLLLERGWTRAAIAAAIASCPKNLADLR